MYGALLSYISRKYYENKITDSENASFPVSNQVSSGLLPRNTGLQPFIYEGWNFNSDNYLFTTDTK